MTTVILSGGSGTRMWPISRTMMPKQFVKFFDEHSLFQKTILRNLPLSDNIMVISNEIQKFIVLDHLYEIDNPKSTFIWESVGKNSAAAMIMAALNAEENEILCLVPSDHLIDNQDEYEDALKSAISFAEDDNIVAIGITPTYAATGFGYICHKDENIESFVEKPNVEVAKGFLDQGNYLWNGGIYCFKASHFLAECQKHTPVLLEQVKIAFDASISNETEVYISEKSVKEVENISIDNALMEKLTSNFKVVPLKSPWNDMGSFDALDALCHKGKVALSNDENVIAINSKNNCILSSKRVIATVGIEDLIIVDTPDALLITKKGASQGVKEVVAVLKERESELVTTPATVARPWGSYTVLENTEVYKTKKIVVRPGKRLSLQSHYHRNEHWIIVSGTARVTVGDSVKLLLANESTYIPAGEKHRLENPGVIDLVMIEAQVGEYLEEDDIVRYDDDFNRTA